MSVRNDGLREWLLEGLAERDMSQAKLAGLVGVVPSAVSRWIARKDVPSRDNCRRLAEVFDANLNYVLALAGHEPMPDVDIDLSDPLLSFFTSHAGELTDEEKRAIIEIGKTILRRRKANNDRSTI